MPLIIDKSPRTEFAPCHSSAPKKANDSNNTGHKESVSLATGISSILHCSQEFVRHKKNTLSHADPCLNLALPWRDSPEHGQSIHIDYHKEIAMAEVMSAGKKLRLQAESLQSSHHAEATLQGWHCSPFKRCLLSIGILTGAGILGGTAYQYYAVRNHRPSEQTDLYPKMTMQYHESDSSLEYSIDITDRARHHIIPPEHMPYRYSAHRRYPRESKRHKGNNTMLSAATKRANHRVVKMLQAKFFPEAGKVSKEKILYAVSAYLFFKKNDITTHNNKVKILARRILAADRLYGGKNNEVLSLAQAKSTVRHWVFLNILGKSPVEFIEDKIKENLHSATYTIANIHHLLNVNQLPAEIHIHFSGKNKRLFTMWKSFLIDEMPFLKFGDKSVKNIPLSSYDFAHIYSGSRFLTTILESDFTAEEALSTGKIMWDLAVSQGSIENKLAYYWAPALFFTVMMSPENTKHDQIDNFDAINNYIQHRKKISAIQQDIKRKYNNYIAATKKWRSKLKLHDRIISQCLSSYFFGQKNQTNIIHTKEQEKESPDRFVKKIYLNGFLISCDNASGNPDDEYQKLTSDVADYFREIDKYIILAAIKMLPEDEQKYISTPEAIVYLAGLKIKTNRIAWSAYGRLYDNNLTISLNKETDLISVRIREQERIYALKAEVNSNEGYRFIRVDRDIRKYIDNSILDYDFHQKYKVESKTSTIQYAGESYSYIIFLNKKVSDSNNLYSVVCFLSNQHHNTLYHALYESGNDKSPPQKIWNIVKHMIPFYDCVEGIINNDPVQAVPSCLMDAITFIPVFGTATSLSERFGIGLARGLRSGAITIGCGGFKSAGKNLLQEASLPMTVEIISLGKGVLNAIDPGVELITDISRIFGKKMVSLMSGNKKTARMAQSIISSGRLDSLPQMPSDTSVIGILPETKQQVPVRQIGKQGNRIIYVRLNPETNTSGGAKYFCQNGILKPFFIKTRKTRQVREHYVGNKDTNSNITHRITRGIRSSRLCSERPVYSENVAAAVTSTRNNIIGTGSISTVYDTGDGYVEKVYKGRLDQYHTSRLKSANNNAKGFNRYYGKGFTTVNINKPPDGKTFVSVRIKKIDGYALSHIPSLTDHNIVSEIASKIKSTAPAEYIAISLQKKGIVHHDINKGNIIYNKGGFFIIDFDSANVNSEGHPVSDSQTSGMRNKLIFVFEDVLRDIKNLATRQVV